MDDIREAFVNPYIQKAVDRFGWMIVIFEQFRIGNTNKYERKEASIISPGVNINSDNFSNITMIIYMEQVKKYFTSKKNTQSNTQSNTQTNIYTRDSNSNSNDTQVNIGIAYVNCLTGENGVMAINNTSVSDISIPLDELLKLLTIKNPSELYIYLENLNDIQVGFSNDDLINALHLFNYNFKIIRTNENSKDTFVIPDIIHKIQYQETLFNL